MICAKGNIKIGLGHPSKAQTKRWDCQQIMEPSGSTLISLGMTGRALKQAEYRFISSKKRKKKETYI